MNEKEIRKINLSIKIIDIKIVDFSALKDLPSNYADSGLNRDKVQFEFNAGTNLDVSNKKIHIDLKTIFFAEKEKKTVLGNLHSTGDFEALNLAEIINDFEGKLPNVVLANLIGVVLSTSRGFLILKSVGTLMEGIIMPMINPNLFFAKQLDVKTIK